MIYNNIRFRTVVRTHPYGLANVQHIRWSRSDGETSIRNDTRDTCLPGTIDISNRLSAHQNAFECARARVRVRVSISTCVNV